MTVDIFGTQASRNGEFAGVFEADDETAYFYLCDARDLKKPKILNSIRISSSAPDFSKADVAIRWDLDDRRVGLFIRGILWAVFDLALNGKYGGNYNVGKLPDIPIEATFRA